MTRALIASDHGTPAGTTSPCALDPDDMTLVQCPSCHGYGWRVKGKRRVKCALCDGMATVTAVVERGYDWSKAATCDEWAPPGGHSKETRRESYVGSAAYRALRSRSNETDLPASGRGGG